MRASGGFASGPLVQTAEQTEIRWGPRTLGLHAAAGAPSGGRGDVAARVASVAQEAVEADDGAPEADASDSRSDQKLKGVQSPASVWLPFRTSTEQKARPAPSAAPP